MSPEVTHLIGVEYKATATRWFCGDQLDPIEGLIPRWSEGRRICLENLQVYFLYRKNQSQIVPTLYVKASSSGSVISKNI